jgi:16S rRNA (uracil1498-N3)-methyltransferase
VARIRPRENVWLFDEIGNNYLASVENITRSQTRLCILDVKTTNSPKLKINLAQSVVKTKAMETIIQKSTELGITQFIPIMTERSIVKIDDNIDSKIQRWRRISLAAAKQSGRSYLPEISHPVPLEDFLSEDDGAEKLFLDEHSGDCFRDIFISQTSGQKKSPAATIVILVGPEGGWTSEEVKKIRDHGFRAINLGRFILKSDTAAIVIVAIVSQLWKN